MLAGGFRDKAEAAVSGLGDSKQIKRWLRMLLPVEGFYNQGKCSFYKAFGKRLDAQKADYYRSRSRLLNEHAPANSVNAKAGTYLAR